MDMDHLLRQHNEIFTLIREIEKYKKAEAVKENAAAIARLLAQLSGIIKMHLLSEDKFLYPALKVHENTKVRETAMKFDDEMKELAQSFEQYKAKYIIASKIVENTNEFLGETEAVFHIINKRMEKENLELYPLLQ